MNNKTSLSFHHNAQSCIYRDHPRVIIEPHICSLSRLDFHILGQILITWMMKSLIIKSLTEQIIRREKLSQAFLFQHW